MSWALPHRCPRGDPQLPFVPTLPLLCLWRHRGTGVWLWPRLMCVESLTQGGTLGSCLEAVCPPFSQTLALENLCPRTGLGSPFDCPGCRGFRPPHACFLHSLPRGPEDTCFEFGVFPATLSFPLDYPLSPPKMRFTCEMFHPNSECGCVWAEQGAPCALNEEGWGECGDLGAFPPAHAPFLCSCEVGGRAQPL